MKHITYRSLLLFLLILLANFQTLRNVKSDTSLQIANNNPMMEISKGPVVDTIVASGRATLSYSSLDFLRVGYNDEDTSSIVRTLLQFSLPEIEAESTILSAKLQLELTGYTTADEVMTIDAYRTLKVWDGAITWNSQDSPSFVDMSTKATTQVYQDLRVYEWDVTPLLQKWVAEQIGRQNFGIQLRGNETEGFHLRDFASTECTDCAIKPVLIYSFAVPTLTPTATNSPTHTPTATHTHTPTPTYTPTPTPGISYVDLRNEPTGFLKPGDFVNYTINFKNGGYDLTNIKLIADLPTELHLIADSLKFPTEFVPLVIGDQNLVLRRNSLPKNTQGVVSYRAQRSTSTPPPTKPSESPAPAETSTSTQISTPTATATALNTPLQTPMPSQTVTTTFTPTQTPSPASSATASATELPPSRIEIWQKSIPNSSDEFPYYPSSGTKFYLYDDGSNDGNQHLILPVKDINRYLINQGNLIGWTLRSIECIPSGSTVIDGNEVTVTLSEEHPVISCTFTNSADANSLVNAGLDVKPEDPIILHNGVTMLWDRIGNSSSITSNSVSNPSFTTYLPIIAK